MSERIAIRLCVTELRNSQEQLDAARGLTELVQNSDLNEYVGVWMQGSEPGLSVHAQSEPGQTPRIHRDWIEDVEDKMTELLRNRAPHAEFTVQIIPESLIC